MHSLNVIKTQKPESIQETLDLLESEKVKKGVFLVFIQYHHHALESEWWLNYLSISW